MATFDIEQQPEHLQRRINAALVSRGAPTKFRPEMPQQILVMMANGYSMAQMCAELGVCRKTFYNYIHTNDDFLHSYKRGRELMQAWFDDLAMRNFHGEEQMGQSGFLLFESQYKRRFAVGENATNVIGLSKCKTDKARVAHIIECIEDQRLTISDGLMMVNMIKTASDVVLSDELADRLEALEASQSEK